MFVLLTVYHTFLSIFRASFYIRMSVVNIFYLSSLLFIGHVPEIKIIIDSKNKSDEYQRQFYLIRS